MIEHCEPRRLLAAAIENRILLIQGTTEGDTFDFQENSETQIRIDQGGIDPFNYVFNYADFDAILLDADDGDDTVTFFGELQPSVMSITVGGGGGNDSIRGGSHSEELRGDDGDDTLDGDTGSDTLIGGFGLDTVTYETRTNPVSVTVGIGARRWRDRRTRRGRRQRRHHIGWRKRRHAHRL